MSNYLLSVWTPEGPMPEPEFLDAVMERLDKVNQEIKDAGAWVFAGGLEAPSTATVLRADGEAGEVLLTDGPFLEAKEYLGGFTIIQADDLDVALHWGRKIAGAIGLPIEVRPFVGEDARGPR